MPAITEKLSVLPVSRGEELQQVVGLVFQKAVSEPHYCQTYADLILALRSAYPKFPATDGGRPITFRSSLIDVCQEEFEALPVTLKPPQEAGEERDAEELELCRGKRKCRMLANMRLIGHLFLRQLLPAKVIVHVLEELIFRSREESKVPMEHAVECACELLAATGHAIEALAEGKRVVVRACGRLRELKDSQTAQGRHIYSKRMQFVIQDLLDVRSAGWTQRSFRDSAKTKEEVQLEQRRDLDQRLAGGVKSWPDDRTPAAGQRRQLRYSTIIGA